MKRRIRWMLFAALLLLTGCAERTATEPMTTTEPQAAEPKAVAEEATVRLITAEEGKAIMDAETGYILLDVRSEEEYREAHIPGAVVIPDGELAARAQKELPDKEQKILVYCRSGRRSAASAQALLEMGYTNVFDMGGIINWPYETVSE